MFILGDELRFAWLTGLNQVRGRQSRDLASWIKLEEFQVYEEATETAFRLFVYDRGPLLRAFAFEINRILSAAIETMQHVQGVSPDEKSLGWFLVQTYYAGFFAAHALMRIWGVSCDLLEKETIKSVVSVADAYGYAPNKPIKGGLWTLQLLESDFDCKQTQGKSDGPHESFWALFDQKLASIAEEVLKTTTLTTRDAQSINALLLNVRENLSFAGAKRGAWLPKIRKAVNYDHCWSLWFPYGEHRHFYQQLTKRRNEWTKACLDISLPRANDDDLTRFQITCHFLVALALESSKAMAERCDAADSFQRYGALALWNQKVVSRSGKRPTNKPATRRL